MRAEISLLYMFLHVVTCFFLDLKKYVLLTKVSLVILAALPRDRLAIVYNICLDHQER